jgi:hypothetical protein
MPDVTTSIVAWWCLAVAVLSFVGMSAFAAVTLVLYQRVQALSAELAGGRRCPDQPRIKALEDFAAGGPDGARSGRHGARPARHLAADPRARRPVGAEESGLLAGPLDAIGLRSRGRAR